MLGAAFNETFEFTVVNAAVLALSAILPVLVASYVRLAFVARRLSPDFELRRLEASELERAELLYQGIVQRLKDIDRLGSDGKSLRERMRRRAEIREQYRAELEDLQAGAHHLRASIVRLRRRPIQRLRHWVHVLSCRYALSGSLASYATILAPLIVFFFFAEQPRWLQDLSNALRPLLTWTPFDERLLYVNGATGALAVMMTPVLYLARRAKLYSDHRTQTQALENFAGANPDQLAEEIGATEPPYTDDAPSVDPIGNDSWFEVLGLSPAATVEEVREAYRTKIKQNHPDRVQDMAPPIRSLAEAETKKLNVAYQEALSAARAISAG
jgi:DnaJ-domain-containing protein 1